MRQQSYSIIFSLLSLLIFSSAWGKVGICRPMSTGMTSTRAASYGEFSSTSICGYTHDSSTEAASLVLPTDSGKFCGACVRVRGTVGEAVFRVTAYCSEATCGTVSTINLTSPAMQRISGVAVGVRPVSWQLVECPVSKPTHFQYRVTNHVMPNHVSFQVLNPRYPVARVEVKTKTGLAKTTSGLSNSFSVTGNILEPVQIRVTDINGSDVVDVLPDPRLLRTAQSGAQQFPACR